MTCQTQTQIPWQGTLRNPVAGFNRMNDLFSSYARSSFPIRF